MDENLKELSNLYLKKAYECLDSAEFDFVGGKLNACINRSYYCIFNCMNACIVINGFKFSKHSAVIAKFRELFIKYQLLPVELNDFINNLSENRNASDYNVKFIPDNITAEECLKSAKFFYDEVKKYLEGILWRSKTTQI